MIKKGVIYVIKNENIFTNFSLAPHFNKKFLYSLLPITKCIKDIITSPIKGNKIFEDK